MPGGRRAARAFWVCAGEPLRELISPSRAQGGALGGLTRSFGRLKLLGSQARRRWLFFLVAASVRSAVLSSIRFSLCPFFKYRNPQSMFGLIDEGGPGLTFPASPTRCGPAPFPPSSRWPPLPRSSVRRPLGWLRPRTGAWGCFSFAFPADARLFPHI